MENCCVGKFTHSECHLLTFVNRKDIQAIEKLSETDLGLLKMRTDPSYEFKNICLHHENVFLKKYEFLHKVCCDPFKIHKSSIRKMLRAVTAEQSKIILSKGFKVKPGQKLCTTCRKKLLSCKEIDEFYVQDSLNVCAQDNACDMEFTPDELSQKKNVLDKLNSSFHEIGCSPMKLHALGEHSRSSYGKEKLQRVHESLKGRMQTVLDIDLPGEKTNFEKSVIRKSEDMDKLVDIIKNELSVTPRKKQIQMLTIPAALKWSRKEIKDTFKVSDYTVRKAQQLFKDKGFLAEPTPKRGKMLSPEIIDLVRNFYQFDEQSRILPGMKDVVSIGKKLHERKRLILCNLSELYSSFKLEYPNLKIGLSKFCSLRPKWCVLAGASGTHLVCVCTIHQNVILLIHGIGIEEDYKELISFLVCKEAERECMLRHCDKCPSKNNLLQFLYSKFEDYDDEDVVEYYQWVSTDRTEMVRCSTSVSEMVDNLAEKLNKLIPHSYIAKSQASFFKNLKATISINIAVVSMDFSKNYAFTIQDEVQGYHWTSNSCTIHPVMIHCKNKSNEKQIQPICMISDDLKHDIYMVYEIQKTVTSFLKENYPHITTIHYFSDGCAGQYKNKNNFLNLCLHEKDFKLKAQWSFFATSHGKTECDGIGGTVKRLAREKSLQQPLDKLITTTNELFEFCKTNITSIIFQYIIKEVVNASRLSLESRMKDIQTLPGTRIFHSFQPIDDLGLIEARRISSDEKPALTFNLLKNQASSVKLKNLHHGCFVACIYDNLWYFGMVDEVNTEEEDVTVKFLHPHGPSQSFFWPNREDTCSIPIPHIIATVETPKTMTGRTYQFSENCLRLAQSSFESNQENKYMF